MMVTMSNGCVGQDVENARGWRWGVVWDNAHSKQEKWMYRANVRGWCLGPYIANMRSRCLRQNVANIRSG